MRIDSHDGLQHPSPPLHLPQPVRVVHDGLQLPPLPAPVPQSMRVVHDGLHPSPSSLTCPSLHAWSMMARSP